MGRDLRVTGFASFQSVNSPTLDQIRWQHGLSELGVGTDMLADHRACARRAGMAGTNSLGSIHNTVNCSNRK